MFYGPTNGPEVFLSKYINKMWGGETMSSLSLSWSRLRSMRQSLQGPGKRDRKTWENSLTPEHLIRGEDPASLHKLIILHLPGSTTLSNQLKSNTQEKESRKGWRLLRWLSIFLSCLHRTMDGPELGTKGKRAPVSLSNIAYICQNPYSAPKCPELNFYFPPRWPERNLQLS